MEQGLGLGEGQERDGNDVSAPVFPPHIQRRGLWGHPQGVLIHRSLVSFPSWSFFSGFASSLLLEPLCLVS
ncbi:hypothetical protein F3Y22_tig00110602pilonHSYRG00253 [Hibiscus syriacus]|uniref:Uncharacterized protein n=1 Tax=Hibiscus syriacus TaxID=106335 RepID=A0A6A3A4I5_HIBSY|nr:hypothetical protein F3Y22_tig00110602pilonHSYRG00253 [Hibiscus syriacus]